MITIYTIRFEGSELSETNNFVNEYSENGFAEDLDMISSWLGYLKDRGAEQRYFRSENNVRLDRSLSQDCGFIVSDVVRTSSF